MVWLRRAAAVATSLGLGGCFVVNGAFEPVGDSASASASSSSSTVPTSSSGDPITGTSGTSESSGGASESAAVVTTSSASTSEGTTSGETTSGETTSTETTADGSSTGPDACAGDPGDLCVPQQIGGLHYLLCDKHATWDEARLICEARCARLVVLDEVESAVIFTHLRAQMTPEDIMQEMSEADQVVMPRASWWIGGRWVDGNYVWLDGTPMPAKGTGGWYSNEPDAPGADSCAALGVFAKAEANGKWFDRSCTAVPYRPLCELL